jgi:hypothetical protein
MVSFPDPTALLRRETALRQSPAIGCAPGIDGSTKKCFAYGPAGKNGWTKRLGKGNRYVHTNKDFAPNPLDPGSRPIPSAVCGSPKGLAGAARMDPVYNIPSYVISER